MNLASSIHHPDSSVEERAIEVLPKLRGAFSLRLDGRDDAVRRPRPAGHPAAGARPARARLGGRQRDRRARHRRRVLHPRGRARRDGRRSTRDGLRSTSFAEADAQGLPVRVRLPRPPRHPDLRPAGARVRVEIGRRLAARVPGRRRPGHPGARSPAPRPRSGTPRQSGIPYGMGLVKNSYVGRTFIQPSQTIRQLGIRLKLNPLRDVIEGKRLVVVDDSIVRGNTQRALVRMLREAGAARGARPDLLAAGEVAVLLRHRLRDPRRADRQRPRQRRDLPLDRRRLARLHLAGRPGRGDHRAEDNLCRACFDGVYPVELPEPRAARQEPPGDRAAASRSTAWPPRWPAAAPPTRSSDPEPPTVASPGARRDATRSDSPDRTTRTPRPASPSRPATGPSS